jgi:hypothetical protein
MAALGAASMVILANVSAALAQERDAPFSVGRAGDLHTGAFGSFTFADEHGTVTALHGNLEWFAFDRFALAAQPFIGYVDGSGDRDNAGLVGFDLLMKWYALSGRNWAIFGEGGAGVQYSFTASFPAEGSHINFRPQVGFGGVMHLADNLDLFAGVRYIHMSNAHVNSPNRAFDGVLASFGAMFQF